ncbi:MAG: SulP family inorganic anion transporter [Methylobacter sp.]
MSTIQESIYISQTSAQLIKSLWGDIVGGSVGALIVVPIILSCGVVSYQSIGPAFVAAGISAAFVAAVVAAVVSGFFGKAPLHVNSPKTTHAAILSGMIANIAIHHSFSDLYPGDKAPVALMTICFLTLLVSGLTQVLIGASRMGALVKFVPYPVLAGFINGFAIQIILTQLPKLVGFDNGSQLLQVLMGTLPVNWWALGFAMLSGGLTLLAGKISKLIPSAILGLLGGTIAQLIAAKYISPADLGPVIGKLPAGIPFVWRLDDILQFVSTTAFSRHAFLILATGVSLAFVSSIQSLLSISSSERLFGVRPSSNRELMIQGTSNILSALFGGTPSGGSPNVTQTVFANGGRTGIANLAFALTLLGLSHGLSDMISLIPLSAMAGVVIVTTAGSMDKWTQQLIVRIGARGETSGRQGLAMNLVVVVLVAALVVLAGALAALGVGMAAVFMVFLGRSNSKMIRRVLYADRFRSRTERLREALETLDHHGRRIAIIELNGPVFFGSAETVFRNVECQLLTADWIILDLKRVGLFDSSGVMMLKRLDEAALKLNKHLLLSYLPVDDNQRHFLQNIGLTRPEVEGRIFEDTDAALSRAEDELLIELNRFQDDIVDEVALEKFDVFRGMTEDEIRMLTGLVTRQQRSAGEIIIREGEECRNLFFLAQGRVSMLSKASGRILRLASYRAGVVLGEMSLLSDQPRSANVIAETPIVLFELTTTAFERLNSEQPALSAKLIRNLATGLSFKLLGMNSKFQMLEA